MWQFSTFPATLILREINFGLFQKVKNCHFDRFNSSNFSFFENLLDIFKIIPKNHMAAFDLLKPANIDLRKFRVVGKLQDFRTVY